MTDILTRLTALTGTDDNGMLPCQCGGGAKFKESYNSAHLVNMRCKKCGLLLSARRDEAVAKWNNRPRESALIALVQEAAGEIERLCKLIPIAYRRGWDKAGYGGICRDAWLNEADLTQAFNQQEAAP